MDRAEHWLPEPREPVEFTARFRSDVAPRAVKTGEGFLGQLANSNNDANPELMCPALKLNTVTGRNFPTHSAKSNLDNQISRIHRRNHGEHLTLGKNVGGRKAPCDGTALGRLMQQGG
jgi:hypothetical protein